MKHSLPVTLILVAVFIVSQLIGLALITVGTDVSKDEQGNVVVTHEDTALGPRPQTTGFASFTYILIGLGVGTLVLLILIKFNLLGVWKLWFYLAELLGMTIAIGALLHPYVALALALALVLWKAFKPNVWLHNITEVLVYSGIGLLVVPIFNLRYVILILVVIAIYDAYAVWRSKHMVKMAQFQTKSKVFAGLLVPYSTKTTKSAKTSKTTVSKLVAPVQEARNAILGGGDIAFPLLFTGVVMDTLLNNGLSKIAAYSYSLIVVAASTAALALLFYFAKKDRFYPAMPFISAGCFVGAGILWILHAL